MKKKFGFTLIELLLVIILMAVIAMMGIGTYQQYSVRGKITKTAQQMQQISQAASAYYTDYGCWPNATNCPTNIPVFQKYVTVAAANPWGQNYSYQIEPTTGKKFQVFSGKLPNPAIAQQVGALLSSAILDPQNNQQVLTEIIMPPQQDSINSAYKIKQVGTTNLLDDGKTFGSIFFSSPINFTCPSGWKGDAIAVPNTLSVLDYDWCITGNRTFGLLQAPMVCLPQANNGYKCQFTVGFNGETADRWSCTIFGGSTNAASGSVAFTYISWCYNPNVKNATEQAKKTLMNLF